MSTRVIVLRAAIIATAAFSTISLASAPVMAGETGVAGALHALAKVGNRICMVDHWHFGDGDNQPSKKAAISAARDSWSQFAALEYGSDWGSLRLAKGTKTTCSKDLASGKWSCSVAAKACRKATRGYLSARR